MCNWNESAILLIGLKTCLQSTSIGNLAIAKKKLFHEFFNFLFWIRQNTGSCYQRTDVLQKPSLYWFQYTCSVRNITHWTNWILLSSGHFLEYWNNPLNTLKSYQLTKFLVVKLSINSWITPLFDSFTTNTSPDPR